MDHQLLPRLAHILDVRLEPVAVLVARVQLVALLQTHAELLNRLLLGSILVLARGRLHHCSGCCRVIAHPCSWLAACLQHHGLHDASAAVV